MSVSDFNAAKKWSKIPKNLQDKLIDNVFCSSCLDVTTIIDYSIKDDDHGIVLKGKCKTCKGNVARFIED
ncbi:hypothetical protein [Tenuibacillus multivorans]|uniref:Uncharacterized protein n=1 Tax=Tenuibacillus multivorans TaxID=237069 RepID=A0A1H0DX89_9BACI|nr:hypothetical protein [Tenuibacillus multivorans]GEL76748.1 hypothetical protein TMU01_09830 [Tenuibacillus multivorans]SDN74646.1 hypothetical protein SAMN05216498_2975 [Tenuibacillus multivorans]